MVNLDHDIFRKRSESRRLDIQVRWFLRKQKKQCPDQVPFGYSELAKRKESNRDTLRNIMTSSVSQTQRKKREAPNEEPRRLAREKGELRFTGTACQVCASTTRYTSNLKCVNCTLSATRLAKKREQKGVLV